MEAYELLPYIKWGSVIIFLLGFTPYLFLILQTQLNGKRINAKKVGSALFFQIPFQVEILKLGKVRWLSHFLIFLSCIWFFLFYWFSVPFRMPFFLHDLMALLFAGGLIAAFLRRLKKEVKSEWEDFYALCILFMVWVSGILVEVAKLQHLHPLYRKGFWLGNFLATIFDKAGFVLPFTPLLIFHIIFVGLFVASLPFTKLFHIVFLPLKEVVGGESDTSL